MSLTYFDESGNTGARLDDPNQQYHMRTIVTSERATGARLTDLGDPKSLAAATRRYSHRPSPSRENSPTQATQKASP